MSFQEKLEEIFTAAQAPGYAIRKIKDGKISFDDFGGLKAIQYTSQITENDLWHIGSCTKSMTSFLMGIFVDEGRLEFDCKIGSVLNNSMIHDLNEITVSDLLTHRSGLPEVTEIKKIDWDEFVKSKEPTEKLRANLVEAILNERPKFQRDTKFEYCNSNYIILGAILEQAYGKSWEQILNEKIFVKLGMGECGFGPAATKDLAPPNQPWGHKLIGGTLVSVQPKESEIEPSDNPASLGPAGTVHCSMDSWTLFLKEMLLSSQGHSTLLSSSTANRLFALYKDNIAGGGWGCIDREWANGPTYMMVGSNELNYAMYVIAPQKNMILMGVTNSGAESALRALSEQFKLLSI